jgi:elongation factor P
MLSSNELRNGTVFKYEGKTWVVIKYEFVKMGRGSGTVKVKAKDLVSSSIVEKGFNLNQKFEEATVEKRSAQYLYADDTSANFMDNESYDQFSLKLKDVEDSLAYIVEGGKVVVVYLDENPISLEIPKTVNLKVVYTEPAVKGDTSNNPMKKAKLETGKEIDVPMFIKEGDVLKVNTEEGTYSERVNS